MENAPHTETRLYQRLALTACIFFNISAFGFLQPFVSLYLEAAGMTRQQIGFVTGVGAGLALLIQPLLGRLSDRLDARRPLMFFSALAAGIAYLSYPRAHSFAAFVVLTALGINGMNYINAASATLVGRLASGAGGGRAYAGYRVWGSVGYIGVALLTGWMLHRGASGAGQFARAHLDAIFTFGPLLFFLIAAITLFAPDRKRPAPAPSAAGKPAPHAAPLPANLNRFLVAFFLYQFALYGAIAYLSLYMKSLHTSPIWITRVFAAGVICEVLVMMQVGHLADLYGRRPVLAIAFLIMPLRLLLYIPATNALWILGVQMLHGFNFGIMGAIAIVFVNDLAGDHNRGTAQARLAGIGGLSSAIAPAVCGALAHRFGIQWMFATMAVVGVGAAVVFLACVRESLPSPRPLFPHGPAYLRPLVRLLTGR